MLFRSQAFHIPLKQFKWLVVPGAGYYGLKNAGFQAARGRYVAFWDSDCRPAPGYALRAFRKLESDPSKSGIAGASFYMGDSYLSRLEASYTFGHLYGSEGPMIEVSPMAHNLVLRKSAFKMKPFGSFVGRLGGDHHAREVACESGRPLWKDPQLNMYHERQDFGHELGKMLEKRFAGLCGGPLIRWKTRPDWVVIPLLILAVFKIAFRRMKRVFIYGKYMSFHWFETLLAFPIILLMLVLDGLLALAMAVRPSFRNKILRYQCGP